MTDALYDRAPGDTSIPPDAKARTSTGVFIYTVGLFLAVVLTATSFWVANTSLLWAPGIALGLAVLANNLMIIAERPLRRSPRQRQRAA